MTTPKDPTTKELEDALRGLDYPAPRAKLVTTARATERLLRSSNAFWSCPETADFVNQEELRRTLGVNVPGEHPHGWE